MFLNHVYSGNNCIVLHPQALFPWNVHSTTTTVSSHPQAVFPCHNWLDKKNGLSVELTPDRDGDGKGDGFFGGPLTEHTITVYTSDVR